MSESTPDVSTSDIPDEPGPLRRWYDEIGDEISRKVLWYELPKALGLAELIAIRDTLRHENLYDTSRLPAVNPVQPPEFDEKYRTERTPDGSWNDLVHPEMGMAGTRFGRNVPLENTWPDEDRMLTPNPRVISRRLMTREKLNPATAGNAIIASWLQFMIHDWFRHGTSPKENPFVMPPVDGDDWPTPPVQVMRTPADPTSPPDSPHPPTYVNTNTHWWDASGIYGSDLPSQLFLREHVGGRMRLVDGLPPIPDDPAADPTRTPGFWLGLGMMQALFTREHNAIAARLAEAHPDFDDEMLFQKARLANCALIAKIHTVEWTPAVTAHPTAAKALNVNWYGLAGEKLHDFAAGFVKDEALTGIPGTETEDYGVPYALTEEFVAVYRMHPLIPDDYDFRSAADDSPTVGPKQFSEITGPHAVPILKDVALGDLLYTFGTMNPGLVTLHNYPRGLQTYKRADGTIMDMASLDVLRCRELGVPRYCEFRRLLHLTVPTSFEEITSNREWARELSEVYDGKLEDLDLIPGVMAEDFPEGFAFSDTAFRIFVLMASRRLNSDRFFTDDFTEEVYTPEGMAWVKENTMGTLLTRHCPELAPYVADLPNAFALWTRAGAGA